MLQMEIFTTGLLILLGVVFILAWILGALFLWIALKLLKVPPERMGFGSVMITTLLCALLESFIPCVGCIIAWYIIKVRHTDTWGAAIAAWFLQFIIPFVIAMGIIFVAGITVPFLAAA